MLFTNTLFGIIVSPQAIHYWCPGDIMNKEIITTGGAVLKVDCFLNFAGEENYLASVNGDIYIKRSEKYELLKKKEEKEQEGSQ